MIQICNVACRVCQGICGENVIGGWDDKGPGLDLRRT